MKCSPWKSLFVQTGSTSSLPPEMLVLHSLRGPEPERKWAQTSIRVKKMVLHCLFFFSLISGTSATRRSFNKKTVQCWITFLMFVAACLAWDNNELTIRQNDAKKYPLNAPSIEWGCFGAIECPAGYHFIEQEFPRFWKSIWWNPWRGCLGIL